MEVEVSNDTLREIDAFAEAVRLHPTAPSNSRDHECSTCHRRRIRAWKQDMARVRLTMARDDRLAVLCGVLLLALVTALAWGAR